MSFSSWIFKLRVSFSKLLEPTYRGVSRTKTLSKVTFTKWAVSSGSPEFPRLSMAHYNTPAKIPSEDIWCTRVFDCKSYWRTSNTKMRNFELLESGVVSQYRINVCHVSHRTTLYDTSFYFELTTLPIRQIFNFINWNYIYKDINYLTA